MVFALDEEVSRNVAREEFQVVFPSCEVQCSYCRGVQQEGRIVKPDDECSGVIVFCLEVP